MSTHIQNGANTLTEALALTGDVRVSGYFRAGSAVAPATTTAGDMIINRLMCGQNSTFSASNGYSARFLTAALTDTANSAAIGMSVIASINPSADSSANFRSLNMSTSISSSCSKNLNTPSAGYFEVRHAGTGNITKGMGIDTVGVLPTNASYAGTVSSSVGIRSQSMSQGSNPTGGTVTSAICFEARDGSKGTGGLAVTTQYGLYVNNMTVGGTNYAIYTNTGLVRFGGIVNTTESYEVDGVQVVGNRVIDDRIDDAINSGDATTDGVIDAIRDALITHGLIAAA